MMIGPHLELSLSLALSLSLSLSISLTGGSSWPSRWRLAPRTTQLLQPRHPSALLHHAPRSRPAIAPSHDAAPPPPCGPNSTHWPMPYKGRPRAHCSLFSLPPHSHANSAPVRLFPSPYTPSPPLPPQLRWALGPS